MQLSTKPFEILLDKRYRIGFHLLFWLVMYLDEFLSFIGITSPYPEEYFWYNISSLSLDVALVYFNFYVLIPRLLLKNKVRWYLGFTFITILIVNYCNLAFEPDCFECEEAEVLEWNELMSEWILGTFLPTLTLLGTAIAVKMFKILLYNQMRLQEVENSKLETEIAYLKDQMNPHFLFNALNGIYVQTRKRPKEASESILLLSDLLRYQLYDCAKEKVYLSGEIEYLKNYLQLDKLRKNESDINFQIKGQPNGKMIAPFIFLPFIENALKHGQSVDGTTAISINFDIGDSKIVFTTVNSKPEKPTQHIGGGIGLNNVKRRLALLYPNKHQLSIEDQNGFFEVTLHLDLS